MVSVFFEGFILGLGAAVPLGPINLLIMNEALRSYKKAVAIGLGAMSADVTYLLLVLYGMSHYLKEGLFLNSVSIAGGLFLLYLAFLIFKGSKQDIQKATLVKDTSIFSKYIEGYILTLLNPYTLGFWLSVTSYSTTTTSLSMTIIGLIFAISLWITLMPYFIYKSKRLITQKISFIIAVISSLILLFFGLTLLMNSLSKALSY